MDFELFVMSASVKKRWYKRPLKGWQFFLGLGLFFAAFFGAFELSRHLPPWWAWLWEITLGSFIGVFLIWGYYRHHKTELRNAYERGRRDASGSTE